MFWLSTTWVNTIIVINHRYLFFYALWHSTHSLQRSFGHLLTEKTYLATHSITEWRFMLLMGWFVFFLSHIHSCASLIHFCNALFFKVIMYLTSPEQNELFLYSFPTWALVEDVKAQRRQPWLSVSSLIITKMFLQQLKWVILRKPTLLSINTGMPKQPRTKDEQCRDSSDAMHTACVYKLVVKL